MVGLTCRHWLRNVAALWRSHRTAGRLRAPRSRRTIPQLEALERRVVPTTLLVNSLNDNTVAGDGRVTLREAILASNNHTTDDLGQVGTGSDSISFASTLTASTPGRITLTLGELVISKHLDIAGPGA